MTLGMTVSPKFLASSPENSPSNISLRAWMILEMNSFLLSGAEPPPGLSGVSLLSFSLASIRSLRVSASVLKLIWVRVADGP